MATQGIINSATNSRIFDPTNSDHRALLGDLATGLQGMISNGQEGEAKRIYNEKKAQYGFTDAEFAPSTAGMGAAGSGGFTDSQVNEWANNTSTAPTTTTPITTTTPTTNQATTAQPTAPSAYNVSHAPAPTPWTVTPEQTVEGRINRLTDPNSPIIQQARTRSAQTMNDRGLLNSSIAMTAADSAAYDAALPIANADAQTYAKAAGYNADQENTTSRFNADASNQFGIARLNADTSRANALLSSETQRQISDMDRQSREAINQANISQSSRENYNSQLNSYYTAFQNTLYQNSTNPNMTPEARYTANANAFALLQQQYRTAAVVAGLPDVSDQLYYNEEAPGSTTPGGVTTPGGTTAPSAANLSNPNQKPTIPLPAPYNTLPGYDWIWDAFGASWTPGIPGQFGGAGG